MGVKKVFKGMGKGFLIIGNTIYSKSFIIAQVSGLLLTIAGLIVILIMSGKKFGLTNLKPLFTMITGVVIALVGLIMIGVSYGIRWKHRMVTRVGNIEAKWRDARRSTSSLRRAYNINKCNKLRSRNEG
ncbi:MAG: hypothetical protein J6P81_00610 [Spirochaetales bacterium]|nr:hypothetical protein [Spirochaetales bacterium]